MINETPGSWEFGPKPVRVLGMAAVTVAVGLSALLSNGPIRYLVVVVCVGIAVVQLIVGLTGRPQFRADDEGVSIRLLTTFRYVRLRWEEIERIDIRPVMTQVMILHTTHDARFLREGLRPRYKLPLSVAGVDPDVASSTLHRLSDGRFG